LAFSIGYRLDAMRYVLSDLHGEYELFEQLLLKLNFSLEDEMYICVDIQEEWSDARWVVWTEMYGKYEIKD